MALREIHTRYSRFITNAINCSSERFNFNNREWEWFRNPKSLFFFSCGALLVAAYGDWITVPYNGRTHFVLFNKFIEKFLPDTAVDFHGETLPPRHPDYVTARRILQDIIRQVDNYKGKKLSDDCELIVLLSDDFVTASDGFRKIYVTTGMLRHYIRQEAMIATILGAKVGSKLAMHKGELVSKFISLVSGIGMSLYLFCKSAYVQSKVPFLEKLMRGRFLSSFSIAASVALLSYLPMMKYMREAEMEGDYIGLMLASSAGYDPRAGQLFPVYGRSLYQRKLPDCFYPTSSNYKRNKRLSQPKVLNEAIWKYNQAKRPQPVR